MREKPLFKIFSWLLLLSVLVVVCHGMCSVAHAEPEHVTCSAGTSASCEYAADAGRPCCPDRHDDSGHSDCDDCINCLCHASITPQDFRLGYLPIFYTHFSPHSFRYLPEVYLPKFIPPQNLV